MCTFQLLFGCIRRKGECSTDNQLLIFWLWVGYNFERYRMNLEDHLYRLSYYQLAFSLTYWPFAIKIEVMLEDILL